MTLRAAWDDEAGDWIRFSGEADVFAWRFNLPAFLELIPPPGTLTVDIGCGEGRVARALMAAGHTVKGIDGSSALAAAIVHPMNTNAGADSYFAEQHLPYVHERDGVRIVLHDMHRPLSAYFEALEAAGFVTDTVREPIPGPELLEPRPDAERWTRTPCFLHLRATRHS